MIGDCIGYRNESSKLIFVRQMFQGKTSADVTFQSAPPLVRLLPSRRLPFRLGRRAPDRQSPN
jgi:hypothetical protein